MQTRSVQGHCCASLARGMIQLGSLFQVSLQPAGWSRQNESPPTSCFMTPNCGVCNRYNQLCGQKLTHNRTGARARAHMSSLRAGRLVFAVAVAGSGDVAPVPSQISICRHSGDELVCPNGQFVSYLLAAHCICAEGSRAESVTNWPAKQIVVSSLIE